MLALSLRDYQRDALRAIEAAARRGCRRQLAVIPTGGGKTVIAAALSQRARGRILFLCQSEELVQQAVEKFSWVWPGGHVGVVQGRHDEHDRRVVVASVQTLARPQRLARLAPDTFSLVILDEAHHAVAPDTLRVLTGLGVWPETPPGRLLLGITATPRRGDRQALGQVFEDITYHIPIARLIERGFLTPPRGYRIQTHIDLSRVRRGAHGEFDERDLSLAVNTPDRNALIVRQWLKTAADRPTVAFTVDVAHATALTAAFQAGGVAAEWVAGSLPAAERAARLRRFHTGATTVVCNALLLTEGWDEPRVSCVILARPTRSQSLFLQMAGRGLRLYPGKTDCLIIDVADSGQDLVTLATLDGFWPDERTRRPAAPVASPRPADDAAALPAARVDLAPVDLLARSRFRWHVARSRMVLEAGPGLDIVCAEDGTGRWTVTLFGKGRRDALVPQPVSLDYAQGIAEEWVRRHATHTYAARDAAWRQRPLTAKQADLLRALGDDPETTLTREAAQDRIRARLREQRLKDPAAPWRQDPATPRQIAWMTARGYPVPPGFTKGDFDAVLAQHRHSSERRQTPDGT